MSNIIITPDNRVQCTIEVDLPFQTDQEMNAAIENCRSMIACMPKSDSVEDPNEGQSL